MYEVMVKVLKANYGTSTSVLKKASLLFLCMMCMGVLPMWAQNIQISGVVTEGDTKESIPGVNIQIEGTAQGVITDFDGKYTISAPANATLLFSFIGFLPQKIAINGQKTIDVKLMPDTKQLDEVVAIGYGTSKKKDLTGSVSSIAAKDIVNIPVSSPAQAMSGRMAGVQVTTADGSPDAEMIIRVRGGGSITGDNTPLYIVDGFPVNSLNDISPADIQTIDVLKDASSTAIYGSKGANGVVIITTKQAKGGKTEINYNGFVQAKRLARRIDVLDSYEYVMLNYELAALDGPTGINNFEKKFGVYEDYDLYKYQKAYDGQEDLFGSDVISTNHNLSINGGSEKTRFALSMTYNKDNGLMENNDYTRINTNFKLNHEISKKLNLSLNTRVTDVDINGSGTAGGTYKIRTSQALTSMAVKGLDAYKQIDWSSMDDEEREQYTRSVMSLTEQAQQYWKKQYRRSYNFIGSLDWEITKGLVYRIEGGYEYGFNEARNYWGKNTTQATYVGGLPSIDWTKISTTRLREAQTLTYKKTIGDHRIDGMIGQELNSYQLSNNYLYGSGYGAEMTPEKIFANVELATLSINMASQIEPEINMSSFFARAGYAFKDRYLTTFTVRTDGSSKFPEGNQWGVFPSAAFAWRLSDEPFMQGVSHVISNMKLRVSYGEAGSDNISSLQYKLQYGINSTKTYGLGDRQNNYYATTNTQLANPDLKWETSVTRNLGLDFGFFKERLSGSLEFFWNSANDLLIERNIVAPGYTKVFENVGATSNKGAELTLNGYIIEKPKFTLSANFNIGVVRSNVDRLADGITSQAYSSGWAGTDLKGSDDYRVNVGEPVGLIYGWVTDGYYTTDDFSEYNAATKKYVLKEGVPTSGLYGGKIGIRPGTLKLKDLDGNGVVDEKDRTVIGETAPDFAGGFGFDAKYHGFDASILFSYVVGQDVYNADKIATSQQYRTSYPNMQAFMSGDNRYSYLDRSTGQMVTDLATLAQMNEGANAKEYWSPFTFGNASVLPHSWAIEDGSFLRLQNVTLGYTLPQKITEKALIKRFRVYCTLNNVWILTNYTGYDPEVSSPVRSSSTSGLTPNVDYSSYPKSFSFTLGANLTF
jgi:TonB-dependent starch-binding outer membrane protein SusC